MDLPDLDTAVFQGNKSMGVADERFNKAAVTTFVKPLYASVSAQQTCDRFAPSHSMINIQ